MLIVRSKRKLSKEDNTMPVTVKDEELDVLIHNFLEKKFEKFNIG